MSPGHHGAAGAGLQHGQTDRGYDEKHEEAGGQLVQKGRRAAGAKRGLRASASERTGKVSPFALLKQDDEDEKQAADDVQNDEKNGH